MSITSRRIERLEAGLDAFISEGEGSLSLDALQKEYAGRPVEFGRDVLGSTYWHRQREILEAVVHHRLVAVRSANSMGKNFAAADLTVYWTVVVGGSVLYIANVDKQLDVGMKELDRALRGSGLPYVLRHRWLEIAGERKMDGRTSSASDNLRGEHDQISKLIIIDEGQGGFVEAVAYDAAFSNAAGELDRILVLGNPARPHGRFHEISKKPNWHNIKIPMFEHPNITEGRTVIPGGPDPNRPKQVEEEYGKDSAFYQSFVEAEFPEQGVEALFRRAWIDQAFENHRRSTFSETANQIRPRLVVDVAAGGPDSTCVGIVQGPVLERFEIWREADLMKLSARLARSARDLARPFIARPSVTFEDKHKARCQIVVDEVGLGLGVRDRLRELSARVDGFNSAARARDHQRFQNRRAEAYWSLRRQLERGEIALPPDERLAEELLATEWTTNAGGRLQIVSKDDIRSRIGRSPDRADVAAMAFDRQPGVGTVPFEIV